MFMVDIRKRPVKGRTGVFIRLIFFSLFSLMIYRPVATQIIDCSESLQAGVYKVYLDELYYDTGAIPSNADLQRLMDKLVFRLYSVIEGVMQEVGVAAPCDFSYCQGRKPRSITDFNIDLVNKLDEQNVILEVWGAIQSEKNDSNEFFHEARIYYLLIPVWLKAYSKPIQPGIQLVEYKSDSPSGTGKPIDLLQEAPEMRIFVEIGIGINQLLNNEYNDARKLLCAARLELDNYIKLTMPDGPSEKEKALINYVDQLARQTVSRAKQDPNYQGALKLIVDDAKCPCLKGGEE